MLERLGRTPNDAKALHSLAGEPGKPMGVLAREWGTDPSAATRVVDRLERLGFASCRPAPGDRRVKLVVLIERGEAVRSGTQRAFHRPPPAVPALGRDELEVLNRVLDAIAASGPGLPGAESG